MTVNGSKDWQMQLAPASSEIFTMGIVVSSNRGYRTLTRALSATEEKVSKEDEQKEAEKEAEDDLR